MVPYNGSLTFSELKIGAWNLNSVWKSINSFKYNKLENPDFLKFVRKKTYFWAYRDSSYSKPGRQIANRWL